MFEHESRVQFQNQKPLRRAIMTAIPLRDTVMFFVWSLICLVVIAVIFQKIARDNRRGTVSIVASITSLLLLVGIFFYMLIMTGKLREWSDQRIPLNALQMLLARSAMLMWQYWYFLVPVVILLCFVIAYWFLPPRNSDVRQYEQNFT